MNMHTFLPLLRWRLSLRLLRMIIETKTQLQDQMNKWINQNETLFSLILPKMGPINGSPAGGSENFPHFHFGFFYHFFFSINLNNLICINDSTETIITKQKISDCNERIRQWSSPEWHSISKQPISNFRINMRSIFLSKEKEKSLLENLHPPSTISTIFFIIMFTSFLTETHPDSSIPKPVC